MLPLVVAQIISPAASPTPVVCARPNVPAVWLQQAEPIQPPFTPEPWMQGTVQVTVAVSVDASGVVTGARIASTPSAALSGVLNPAALAAARASTFRPEIRNCRPIAGEYLYVVDFEGGVRLLSSERGRRVVSVAGDGHVLRPPDLAYVEVRMVANDESASRAAEKNEAQLKALVVQLRPFGLNGRNVRLLRSSNTAPPGGGFASSQEVAVTVDAPVEAAKVAAAIAAAGSFEVLGIRYALNASGTAYEDALRAAVDNAEARAQRVASAYHLRVGTRRSVQESQRNAAAAPPSVFERYVVPPNGRMRVPRVGVSASATIVIELES
jgi:uncharacterized protein YggE